MFDHVTARASDHHASRRFYETILAPLGHVIWLIGLVLLPLAVQPGTAYAGSGPPAEHQAHSTAQRITAERLLQMIGAGETPRGVVVVDHLDLRSVQTFTRPFRCLNCVFQGSIRASDVIFRRVVDLSGAQIAGSLDLRAAVFGDAVIFRSTSDRRTFVGAESTFALAAFGDRADFDGATFKGRADFTGVRFLGDASFANADFRSTALFDLASFRANAQFSGSPKTMPSKTQGAGTQRSCSTEVQGAFGDLANFSRATFGGNADFRQRCFVSTASFAGASFQGWADFALASFEGGARFDGAAFQRSSSFRVATFAAASFEHATASERLDFDGAVLYGQARLFGLIASGSLSLEGILLGKNARLVLSEVQAENLVMDLEALPNVPGELVQEETLVLIEESARKRGDLAIANEARFRRLSLKDNRSEGLWNALQGFLHGQVAGYFVDPTRPFVAFFVLLGLAAAVRAGRCAPHLLVRRKRSSWKVPLNRGEPRTRWARVRGLFLNLEKALAALVEGLWATGSAALRPKPTINVVERERVASYGIPFAKLIEYLAFKFIIAAFLIGLANSNSTLRQLVDAVL